MPGNPYADAARMRKAIALEAVLREAGVTLAQAETALPPARRLAERTARVRTASEETWQLVFTFMRDAEMVRAPVRHSRG